MTKNLSTAVTIVGGGYSGLSTALHLAQVGVQCVLIESGDIGAGASGRNGGQVIAGLKYNPDELIDHFGDDLGARMVRTVGGTADLVFSLIERHGIDCNAIHEGWIQGAHSEAAFQRLKERARQWSDLGVDNQVLDAEGARALIGSSAYVGAWLDKRGGTVQPLNYARGLAAAAARLGAQIYVNSPARRLVRDGSRWVVHTDGGEVKSDQVVIATNAYSDELWPGLRRTVVPAYSIQVATVPLPDVIRRSILPGGQAVSETRRVLRYCRIDPEGRFIIGSLGPDQDDVTFADADFLRQEIKHLFPQAAAIPFEYVWSGFVGVTADHLPHMHELAPGVHTWLGCNGRGVALATMMGKLLAERANGASAEEIDFPVTTMRPIRFHAFSQLGARLYAQWYTILDRLGV